MRRSSKTGLVWGLGGLLFLAHYDFWYWNDGSLVFGFLPVGLAYHVAISVAASLCWVVAVVVAWPSEIEDWADETDPAASETGEPL